VYIGVYIGVYMAPCSPCSAMEACTIDTSCACSWASSAVRASLQHDNGRWMILCMASTNCNCMLSSSG